MRGSRSSRRRCRGRTGCPGTAVLTLVLMVLLAFTVVQLVAPGEPFDWFGADVRPGGWKGSEAWLYLATEFRAARRLRGCRGALLAARQAHPHRERGRPTPAQTEREPALD